MNRKEEILSTNISNEDKVIDTSSNDIVSKETNDIQNNNEIQLNSKTELKMEEVEDKEIKKDDEVNIENIENSQNNILTESQEDNKREKSNKAPNNTDIPVSESAIKTKKSYKTPIIILISAIAIILLFLLFSTVFALMNFNNTKIIKGVTIKDVDVSGLTKKEALVKVSDAFDKKLSESITLKHNEYTHTIVPSQFDVTFSLEDAIDIAYNTGRSGNIFQNNYQILTSLLFGIEVSPGFSYNEDAFNSLVNEMQVNFSDRLIEASYYIENNNLIISKGKDGLVIDKDKLKNKFAYIVNNLNCADTQIDIPTKFKKTNTLDLNTVYNEVCKKPTDAYFTTEPYTIYPHSDGIDFAISMEEATKLFNTDENSCSIPLKVLSASVKVSDLGAEAFPDLLATYYTTYSTKNVNRSTNIRLASQKINGTVIMPQESFSYNTTVGKRTTAAGFKSAAVYAGGKVTEGIGGGICQVSSTLYNSVLLSNLEIVERYNHGFNPGYVPAGRDATVSWGGPDFKFKNNRDYPIKIVCSGTNGKIKVDIYGLKDENEYTVEIQSYITRYIAYRTIEQKDSTLAKGKTKVIESGSNGCQSVCYRILKQNGKVVSKTLLSTDTYNPHNRIVAVGTKESAPTTTEPPATTPTTKPETSTTPNTPTPAEGTNSNT